MSRPRFDDLNGVHVTASALAALTGAVVTSDFGTAGTLVGTAVASMIGTTGTAVYQHYLGSTKKRISAAAPVIAQRTHIWHPAPDTAGAVAPGAAGAVHAGSDPPPAGPPERGDSGPGEEPTQILAQGAATSGDIPPGEETARLSRASDAGGERDGLAHPPETPPDGEEMPGARHPAGGGRAGRGRRGRWVMPAVAAAAFVIALVAVTVFEVAIGKPLDAALWGHKGAGTTVGDVVTGTQGAPQAPAPRPSAPGATSPAVSPTPSPSPTPPSSGTSPSAGVSPSPSGGNPSVGPGLLGGSPSPGRSGASSTARPSLRIPLP